MATHKGSQAGPRMCASCLRAAAKFPLRGADAEAGGAVTPPRFSSTRPALNLGT